MKRLRAWLGVLLIFLLGAVCGGILTAGVTQQKTRLLIKGGSATVEDPIVTKLRKQLSLDATQQTEVRQIVADARAQLEAIKQRVQPESRAILRQGEEKVRALLRPDQAARFDKLVASSREKERAEQ